MDINFTRFYHSINITS